MEWTVINLGLAVFEFMAIVGITLIINHIFKMHFPKKGDFIKALKGDTIKEKENEK